MTPRLMAACLVLVAACSGGLSGRADGGGGGGAGGAAGGTGGGAGGAAGGTCAFASTYTVVDGGGLVPVMETVTLSPPAQFRFERRTFGQDAGTISCTPALPSCPDAARVDVADVEAAIAHADVQSALGLVTRPIYGDRGMADGPMFTFTRADGRGFTAGIACTASTVVCTPIPPGVTSAMQVIRALIDQQLADPTCDQLR